MRKYDCDVLVVGSGAGGLATAVAAAHRRLKVLVVEKEPVFGGTTARSGGWMWVPNNGPAKRAGVQDSIEKAAPRRRQFLTDSPTFPIPYLFRFPIFSDSLSFLLLVFSPNFPFLNSLGRT